MVMKESDIMSESKDMYEFSEINIMTEVKEEANKVLSSELVFPCVLIKGFRYSAEVLYMRSKCLPQDTLGALPLYLEFNGVQKYTGHFILNMRNLLMLRQVDKNYEIYLMFDENTMERIDINSPDTLLRYLEIGD